MTEKQTPKKAPFAESVSAARRFIGDHKLETAAVGLGLTAAVVLASGGAEGGNEKLPPLYEITPAEQVVNLDTDAIIRFDPIVKNGDDTQAPNDVLHLDAPLDVISLGYIEGTSDGTWYVVSGSSLRDALAGSQPEDVVEAIKNDKDGRLFVNEQGVSGTSPLDYGEPSE